MSSPTGETAGVGAISLADLHAANIARQAEWCPDQVPDLSFRGNEIAGEAGETSEALILHAAEISRAAGRASNVVKKLERERYGWRGSRATKDDLADELADMVICADLCAVTAEIDLGAAVVAKFNATSEKVGLSTRLEPGAAHPTPATPAQGSVGGVSVSVEEIESIICTTIDIKFGPGEGELTSNIPEVVEAILARLTAPGGGGTESAPTAAACAQAAHRASEQLGWAKPVAEARRAAAPVLTPERKLTIAQENIQVTEFAQGGYSELQIGFDTLVEALEVKTTLEALTPSDEQVGVPVEGTEATYRKLDDDSLDAIMEVIGEGSDFKQYNKGKSAMRDWFLRRLRTLWNLPEPLSARPTATEG